MPDVRRRAGSAALRDDVAGAAFALPALRANAELELDLVETEASAGMAGNFAIRDTAADTDDHGWTWLGCWRIQLKSADGLIINANLSHLQ